MFDRASSAVGESRPRRRRRTAESTVLAAAPAAPARRRRPRGRAVKGRATPPEVTTEVVRAVIAKLGQGTAAEIASEIYSTAGDYDLLVKFYVDNETDIGHFVNEKVQVIPGIQDTHTIITFKAFGTG